MSTPKTPRPAPDSKIQQAFFDYIKHETDSEKILLMINGYRTDGKSIPWFQDVIPELVPGVWSDKQWVESARAILWTVALHEEHNRKLGDMKVLQQNIPPKLSTNNFGLRRYWPVVIEFLKPMSKQLMVTVDQVSSTLARTDCLLLDPNRPDDSPSTPEYSTPSHEFVVTRQAVQDKVLSPLIDAVHVRLQRQDSSLDAVISDLRTMPSNEIGVARQHLAELQQNVSHSRDLKEALCALRRVIVQEKEIRDGPCTSKKRTYQGSSTKDLVTIRNVPTTTPGKRQRLWEVFDGEEMEQE
jgi:hypothetical protein